MIHVVFTNYQLCINLCILSVTFAAIYSQEHQILSSHNQFTMHYFDCKLFYYGIYIIYLLTEKETYTGNPCFIKPNIAFIISLYIDVPYIDMSLYNITDCYLNCDRVKYYPIFKQQNITFGFYLDSQVPYFLSLIYILFCLVKLCANITSLIHVLDIMSFMFIISLLYLITYNFKVAGFMYLTIIISAQNLYIYNELQFHISSVLTNELYIFKCACCIHCNGISGNLLINN